MGSNAAFDKPSSKGINATYLHPLCLVALLPVLTGSVLPEYHTFRPADSESEALVSQELAVCD